MLATLSILFLLPFAILGADAVTVFRGGNASGPVNKISSRDFDVVNGQVAANDKKGLSCFTTLAAAQAIIKSKDFYSIDSAAIQAAGFGFLEDGSDVPGGTKSKGHRSITVKTPVSEADLKSGLNNIINAPGPGVLKWTKLPRAGAAPAPAAAQSAAPAVQPPVAPAIQPPAAPAVQPPTAPAAQPPAAPAIQSPSAPAAQPPAAPAIQSPSAPAAQPPAALAAQPAAPNPAAAAAVGPSASVAPKASAPAVKPAAPAVKPAVSLKVAVPVAQKSVVKTKPALPRRWSRVFREVEVAM